MSNELKATKGPWEISWNTFNGGESHGVYAFGELDLKGHQIAIVNYWPTLDKEADEQTGKANVQLIAAAPDLYTALKEVREWYERSGFHTLAPETPVCFSKALSALMQANPSYKH